jgi:hypothetical protein
MSNTPGIYVGTRFSPESGQMLQDWSCQHGIKCLPAHKLHCTIMYSPVHFRGFEPHGDLKQPVEISPKTYSLDRFGSDKQHLVLKFTHPWLSSRHNYAKSLGAEPTFTPYQPHVTLSNEWKGKLPKVSLPTDPLHINHEYMEALNPDFSALSATAKAAFGATLWTPVPTDLFSWFGSAQELQEQEYPRVRATLQEFGYVNSTSNSLWQLDLWQLALHEQEKLLHGYTNLQVLCGSNWLTIRPAQAINVVSRWPVPAFIPPDVCNYLARVYQSKIIQHRGHVYSQFADLLRAALDPEKLAKWYRMQKQLHQQDDLITPTKKNKPQDLKTVKQVGQQQHPEELPHA